MYWKHIETKNFTQTFNIKEFASRIVAERMGMRTTDNKTATDRRGNKQLFLKI